VTSSYGNSYHSTDSVESGQFAFTAAETGDYMACFYAPDHTPPITVTVDFEWRTGVAAKDWSSIAKKGSVEVLYFSLAVNELACEATAGFYDHGFVMFNVMKIFSSMSFLFFRF